MLYFGPETYLPLASAAAGLVGLILTFWRRVMGFARRILGWRSRSGGQRVPGPGDSRKEGRDRAVPPPNAGS